MKKRQWQNRLIISSLNVLRQVFYFAEVLVIGQYIWRMRAVLKTNHIHRINEREDSEDNDQSACPTLFFFPIMLQNIQ